MHFESTGILGHLPHRGRQSAGAVVGDGTVQAPVPGNGQQVEHPPLGDRIANLHRGYRRSFMKLFRGEGGAVNAVLADAPSDHDDMIADLGLLFVARTVAHPCRHEGGGSTVHQRLAGEPLIENDGAVDRGNAALVAAMLDPFDDSFEDSSGVEQPRRQGLVVKGRGKAEDVGVENQPGAKAGAEGIAVHADDAG